MHINLASTSKLTLYHSGHFLDRYVYLVRKDCPIQSILLYTLIQESGVHSAHIHLSIDMM